ncbi:MAG TPA: hypothetical protein VK843_14000 [Planctomycetota bacterium]|nr:hypothetical protein [Planctomycetota bacterium]
MRIRSLASALLVTPLLLALSPRADEISFHPKDGSKLTKQFTITGEIELGDVTLDVAGQDVTGELPSDVSAGFEVSLKILDDYVKVEGGKPLELLRQFVQFNGSYHAMEESESTDDMHDIDTKVVRFKWNEDKQVYDITVADDDTPPEQLRVMGVDMDLRSLLPAKSVSQGDAWDVDGKQLAAALIPGIDLGNLPDLETLMEDETDPESVLGLEIIKSEFIPQLEKLRDACKTTATYTGQREIDGRTLAAIRIKLDVAGSIDMLGFMRIAMKEGAELDEDDYDIEAAALEVTFRGEGELLWDIEAGIAHGFDFSAKLELAAKLAMSISGDGETVDVEGEAELLGKGHWAMELK